MAGAAAEDEAVAIVKQWKGDGYFMDVGTAAESLLRGFEAGGETVQRVGWYGTATATGHVDVRYNFLLNGANTEMIFLYDREEGSVVPANDWARAAVTLALTVDPGGHVKATKPTMRAGGERTPADVQAEVEINKAALENLYEDYLNRNADAGGKLKLKFTITTAGTVKGVEIVESTINYKPLEVALVRAVEKWVFTPATNDVTLTYPFVFYRKR
jgi:TonB family protein